MYRLVLLVNFLASCATVSAQAVKDYVPEGDNMGLRYEKNKDTSVLRHKRGFASVLELWGDRGTGLKIVQGNKQATGISVQSGNAINQFSPSAVAAGMPQVEGLLNRETAGLYVKMSGAKIDGDFYFVVDPKTKQIGIYDASDDEFFTCALESTTPATPPV